ncbi:MAG: MerR family transcriptional regulator [Chloroflexi bacterium]|nr:MerR family transcriptional regulator [Chloroflexota bacterium]
MKQVADLAQISVRTLHYYDEIGLLRPAKVAANGYRCYDDAALLRLQKILFYREIGLELTQIKAALDSADFDVVTALKSHHKVLAGKIERLHRLIATVETTIKHLSGEEDMPRKRMFEAFSEEKQKDYEREARLQYGPDLVNQSIKRWKSYTQAQKDAIMAEGNQIYNQLTDALEAGTAATDERVQAILVRWHNHIRYFYEPTLEILRGLGQHYEANPDFAANFQKLHPDLPGYLREGITQYVDTLETAEIAQMLAEDEAKRSKNS